MVILPTFYSSNPSSNPAEAYSIFSKVLLDKNENKQKKRSVLVHLKSILIKRTIDGKPFVLVS